MKKYIFGNWKQNGDAGLVKQMIAALQELPPNNERCVVIFPPEVYLTTARNLLLIKSAIQLGAQNLSAYPQGPYTGEVSGEMLKEVGADFVLVGHSECRQFFGDTDQVVAAKFQQALSACLIPVLCVGESLQEYEAGETQQVIQRQLLSVLQNNNWRPDYFFIAYEPVWAIGTGKSATAQQAQSVHAFIREQLSDGYGKDFAAQVPLLYGGSVKSDNAAALMAMPDINGVLVGGASLIISQFSAIAQAH
jgi:triosephosphate isomerase